MIDLFTFQIRECALVMMNREVLETQVSDFEKKRNVENYFLHILPNFWHTYIMDDISKWTKPKKVQQIFEFSSSMTWKNWPKFVECAF